MLWLYIVGDKKINTSSKKDLLFLMLALQEKVVLPVADG